MDVVLRVVVLTAIYLLVLTSVHPGDVLTGVVLSVAARRRRPADPAARAARGRTAGHDGSPECLG